MYLYSPDGTTRVDCHPSQIENMRRQGWTDKPPEKARKNSETRSVKSGKLGGSDGNI